MADKKLREGDKLPTSTSPLHLNEELAYLYENNEAAADINGIFYDKLPTFPYFSYGDINGMSQSFSPNMPLPVNNMIDGISPYSLLHYSKLHHNCSGRPVSDHSSVEGNVNESFQCHDAVKDFEPEDNKMHSSTNSNVLEQSKTEGNVIRAMSGGPRDLQMSKEHREADGGNYSRPWLSGNERSHGHSTTVPGNKSINGELVTNSVMRSDVQYDNSVMLDGSFLTLGVNAEPMLNSNAHGRDGAFQANMDISLNSDTYCHQNATRSAVNPQFVIADGFCNFHDNAGRYGTIAPSEGGFSTLGQNVASVSQEVHNDKEVSSLVQNAGEMPNLVQNVDGFNCQGLDVNRSSSLLQSVGGASQLSKSESSGNLSQLVDKQHCHYVPSIWQSGIGANWNGELGFIDPYTGLRGFSTMPIMPHVDCQYAVPNNGQCRMRGLLPSSSSLVRGNAAQYAYVQQRNPDLGIIRNFSSGPPLASPFAGFRGSITGQQLSGQPFQLNEVNSAQAAGGLHFENVGIQPPSQEIPAASRPPQASSVSLGGPSLKRGRTLSSPGAAWAQHKRIRPTNMSNHPSSSNVAQTAPTSNLAQTAPSLNLAQTAPSLNLAQTALPRAPLVRTARSTQSLNLSAPLRPPLVPSTASCPRLQRVTHISHIKWQAEHRATQPSGKQCHICKRDLLYAPEGHIRQPADPPPVAVLPCQHHFHDYCLQRITPQDQAQNPPCIPCAMGDKN